MKKNFAKALEPEQCQIKPFLLYPIDLDGDKQQELVFIDPGHNLLPIILFARNDSEKWRKQGILGDGMNKQGQERVVQQLKLGITRPGPPLYQSLKREGTVSQFSPGSITDHPE